MYKVVKIVNGYTIWKMEGTCGHYTVRLDAHRFQSFRTVKEAAAFCEKL